MASTARKTFHIGGMTCVNCQSRIERALRKTAGVTKVSVSYRSGIADVTYDPGRLSPRDIAAVIERLDYQVLPEHGGTRQDPGRVVCTLAIILCGYLLPQKSGVLNLLAPSQLADTGMSYGLLLVTGLITSVHCIAMCGGINLSQCVPRGDGAPGQADAAPALLPAVLYNLGRVISYTAVGFLLGLAGSLLGGGQAGPSTLLQGVLKLAAGALMVLMGVNLLGLFPGLRALTPRPPKFLTEKLGAGRAKAAGPLAVGLLNGLMPCGPLQSMQLVAFASGSPLAGALSMLMFSLGTVPLMLGLGSIVSLLGKKFARGVNYVGAVLVAVLGLSMLSQGASLSGLLGPDTLLILIVCLCVLGMVASIPLPGKLLRPACLAAVVCVAAYAAAAWGGGGAVPDGTAAAPDSAGRAEVVDGVQMVTSTLASGRYPDITVQAGTPVVWTIDAPAGSINGCNYRMLLQEYRIEHTFQTGENVIEFTPTTAGTFQYSCWMGMIRGSITVTAADPSAGGETVDSSSPV